jgi:hypothetical protein
LAASQAVGPMPATTKTLQYDVALKIVALKQSKYVAPRDYTAVSPDAATVLAKHHERLELPGLERVSPRVAAALATQKGTLALNGFRTMAKSVAQALAAHEGKLILRNLATLDTESLEALAAHAGPVLLPAFRPAPDDDLRQRQVLARHGNLRYDVDAVDVFAGIDFGKYPWSQTKRGWISP